MPRKQMQFTDRINFHFDTVKRNHNCNRCKKPVKIGEKRLTIASPYNYPEKVCMNCVQKLIRFLSINGKNNV